MFHAPTQCSPYCIFLLLLAVVYHHHVHAKPPHMLFILADDYGWNDVGYHGSEIHTPNIDKLAGEGVKLENYYVQHVCTPSRSQLLSGRYQIHTGLQHMIIWVAQPNALPLEDKTIADKLKEQGYATHMVGKWHIGFYKKEFLPTRRGFDSYFGYLASRDDYFHHNRCYTFNTPDKKFSDCGLDFHNNEDVEWGYQGQYSTHLFTSKAEDVVAKHAKDSPDKPLFLFLSLQAVHEPLQAPQEYIDRYSWIKNKNRRTYAGMVSAMDEAVANVTNAFKKHGLWDDTLVMFSTDNGGQVMQGGNNWPLRGWKGSLFEGGIRAVGFASGPVLPQSGWERHDLMHVTDWYPTMLRLAGGNTTGLNLDGYDMWDTLSKGVPGPRHELLHNIDPVFGRRGERLPNSSFDNTIRAAIRVDNWKLLTGDPNVYGWVPPPKSYGPSDYIAPPLTDTPKKNIWLFDVELDPLEKVDLSDMYPDVVHKLLDKLTAYNAGAETCRYPSDDPNAAPTKHNGTWIPWA